MNYFAISGPLTIDKKQQKTESDPRTQSPFPPDPLCCNWTIVGIHRRLKIQVSANPYKSILEFFKFTLFSSEAKTLYKNNVLQATKLKKN